MLFGHAEKLTLIVPMWSSGFRSGIQFGDFKELVAWILKENNSPEYFAMIVWPIWNQRNQVRLQHPCCALHLIPQLSKDQLEEFLAMQPPPKPPPILTRVCWRPPPPGFVKVNFDEVVFSEENKAGAGIVIRNREGFVLSSQSQQLNQAYSPSAIEAIATHTGLQLATKLGFTQAVLEGDSLTLMSSQQH
ncbi:uncharacterized protein LOC142633331 [Castanea sativa]|uniref:uncharacterized protein LOC142633331 n=1 Tax=Castanea sativa TaxID=21020 RepID=UPI003F64974F